MTVVRILFAVSVMTPFLASAQTASPEWPVTAGSTVRIESAALGPGFHKGTVVTATSDTLLFQPKGGDIATIPIGTPNIARMEIVTGKHTNKTKGALFGLLIGAGAGAILGAAAYQKTDCTEICILPDTRSFDAAIGAALLATAGALVGLLLGAHPTETWTAVAVPRR